MPDSLALPTQHVRTVLRLFDESPELAKELLNGTGITYNQLIGGRFSFYISQLWSVCDNLRTKFGEGWFLSVPALWSLETQSEFGLAMRYAQNFSAALDLIEELWNRRWPIGHVHIMRNDDGNRIAMVRTIGCSNDNWMTAASVVALNFSTASKAMLNDKSCAIKFDFAASPPPYSEMLSNMLCGVTTWNNNFDSIFIEKSLLDQVPPTSDNRSFAGLVDILRKRTRINKDFDDTSTQVLNLLLGIGKGKIDAPMASKLLGLSTRSLERKLAIEGTCFRDVSNQAARHRIDELLRTPNLTAEKMAEQLGYHDGSSLMRACRRLYGKTLSQLRIEMENASISYEA